MEIIDFSKLYELDYNLKNLFAVKQYWKENSYQVEYYFTEKNEQNEAVIEEALLDNGYLYEKSEDIFIESEGVFVIYYYI